MRKAVMIVLMFVVATVVSREAVAQTATAMQALYFGEWIFYNNNANYDITVNTAGGYAFDSNGVAMLIEPEEGIYDIEGLTPGAEVDSVVITQATPLVLSGSSLTINSFHVLHPQYVDGSGHLIITIGATATTTGTGVSYPDGIYSGSIDVDITLN